MVQYKMEQLNLSGEISGYYNESWSEAEICKTLLNPAELGFQIDRDFQRFHWLRAFKINLKPLKVIRSSRIRMWARKRKH